MAEGSRPLRALVTDAGRGSALCIVRSLGRSGWRVVAADQDARSPGFRSRHVESTWLYPDPRESPRAFVRSIRSAVEERTIDLVLPVTDDALLPLSEARDDFAGSCRLAIPEAEALAVVCDKQRTLELARGLGVPVPRTIAARTRAEAERAGEELGWPVVVKPVSSRHLEPGSDRLTAHSVSHAGDRTQLLARLAEGEPGPGWLLQEHCGGPGIGVEILSSEGRVLLAFQHRRLAEIPVSGGASAWRESVALDPALYGHARRLVEALRWTGPIMIEFKGDERPVLMEINGRIWGSLPLAVRAGADFPRRWAELCVGRADANATCVERAGANPTPPASSYRVGVRAYDLDRLLLWVVQLLLGRGRVRGLPRPPRRRVLAALAALRRPGRHWDFADDDDPGPARAELRALPGRWLRRLRRRRSAPRWDVLRERFLARRSPEERLLLGCARQELGASDREALARAAAAGVRWDAFLAMAEAHQIAPLVFENLRRCDLVAKLPSDVAEGFARASERTRREKAACALATERAVSACAEWGLDVMLLKGAALDEAVFERDWYTQTSDVDLALRAGKADLGEEIRARLRSWSRERPALDVSAGLPPDLRLHGLLRVDEDRLWSGARRRPRAAGDAHAPWLMDLEDQLLCACIGSASKGFFRAKSLCGIADLVRRSPALDWDELGRRAGRDGAAGVVHAALVAAALSVGCPLPGHLSARLGLSRARAALQRGLVLRLPAHSLERDARRGPRLAGPARWLLAASAQLRPLARLLWERGLAALPQGSR